MLSLKPAKVTVLYIEGVGNFWFSGIYNSVGILLLIFSYVESNSVG